MKRIVFYIWLIAFVSIAISGCVVVIGDEESDGVHWASEYDEIREQSNRERTDAAQALLDEVRRGLDGDEFLRREAILVSAKDGVITLSGEASSVGVVDRAVQIAVATDGVESVISRVVVFVEK